MNKPACCTDACTLTLEQEPGEGNERLWNWKHNIRGVLDYGGVIDAGTESEATQRLARQVQLHHDTLADDLIAQQKEREDYIAKVEAKRV